MRCILIVDSRLNGLIGSPRPVHIDTNLVVCLRIVTDRIVRVVIDNFNRIVRVVIDHFDLQTDNRIWRCFAIFQQVLLRKSWLINTMVVSSQRLQFDGSFRIGGCNFTNRRLEQTQKFSLCIFTFLLEFIGYMQYANASLTKVFWKGIVRVEL